MYFQHSFCEGGSVCEGWNCNCNSLHVSVTFPDSLLTGSGFEPFGALVGEENGRQPWFVTRSDAGLVDLALFHDALLERLVWSGRN
jgi:hypothetical protein